MPKVTLITHTPDPEMTIASAARLCYSPATIAQVQEKLTPEKAGEFVEMLAGLGHQSPIEHAVFTFGIEGVSRALLAQITRHRIASFSVQSQRYVRENDFEVVVPPQIAEVQEAREEFELAMQESIAHYQKIAELLKARREKELLAEGLSPKAAASRPPPSAAMIQSSVFSSGRSRSLSSTGPAERITQRLIYTPIPSIPWHRYTSPHSFPAGMGR